MDAQLRKILDDANKQIFVKQYKAAERILKAALGQDSERVNLLVHLRWIELQVKLGNIEQVVEDYEQRISKTNQPAVTNHIALSLALQFGERQSPLESMARYQKILDEYGPNPSCYFGIGLALEAQGNVDRAIYNYEQSIQIDSDWFPSYFALSQLYYSQGKDSLGDYYFFIFEEKAPYNVYGNFETHRKLFKEFLADQKFGEAEAAVATLCSWWLDNKNYCPPELRIFETLSNLEISKHQEDAIRLMSLQNQLQFQVKTLLQASGNSENALMFSAKILEEAGFKELSLSIYQKILSENASNVVLVQKIGSQLLNSGDFDVALQLFGEAYRINPDNNEIRFCLLIARLHKENVAADEYLLGKERLMRLLHEGGDKVEILSLLHALLAKFKNDPDVHVAMGDLYASMGNISRAANHYEDAAQLDLGSRRFKLKYASFLMSSGNSSKASEIIDGVRDYSDLTIEEQSEIFWLKANIEFRSAKYAESKQMILKALGADPWNTSFIVLSIAIGIKLYQEKQKHSINDDLINKLLAHDESKLNWKDYDAITTELSLQSNFELCFLRQKLRFLYTPKNDMVLAKLLEYAKAFDAKTAIFDFKKLLNTNFDHPILAISIAGLYKDLWQLETAISWYEYAQNYSKITQKQKAFTYMEIADCWLWLDKNTSKALEYAQAALDLGLEIKTYSLTTLVHANLKSGKIQAAQAHLQHELAQSADPEMIYLKGLVLYRNGAINDAKKLWKPLLTYRSDSLKHHHIKQDLMRYYFDSTPYLRVNAH